MINFTKFQSVRAWLSICNGSYNPIKVVEGMTVPKLENEWDDVDLIKMKEDALAINMLHCALDAAEYNEISGCETAWEIRKKLEVTYEGTEKVKESKINLLMGKHEIFHMEVGKNISSMNTRDTQLVNELKRLRKVMIEEERVKKILRSLTIE